MRFVISVLLAVLMLVSSSGALAQESDKPFAEAHVVLQLADGDEETQARTLSVANNLIKHYGGPDFIDIEIVAYGPGISLLYPDNANTLTGLLREADQAMYRAKARCRGVTNIRGDDLLEKAM